MGGAFEPFGLPAPPDFTVSPQREIHRAGDGTLSCSADVLHFPSSSGDAEAQVVVAVPGLVPVAVRRPAIPRRVAPVAAAVHAELAGQVPDRQPPPRRTAVAVDHAVQQRQQHRILETAAQQTLEHAVIDRVEILPHVHLQDTSRPAARIGPPGQLPRPALGRRGWRNCRGSDTTRSTARSRS